jgi:hypothetical protein
MGAVFHTKTSRNNRQREGRHDRAEARNEKDARPPTGCTGALEKVRESIRAGELKPGMTAPRQT